jgi:uncharacterized protein YqiB (DUF1249 family)
MATLFGLSIIIAVTAHIAWFARQRSAKFPAIGTKWTYGTYMKRYVAEVIEHHPFTNEITVIRTEEGSTLSVRMHVRIDSEKFMASVVPYREKR